MIQDPINNEKILFSKIAVGDETAFRELFHLYIPQIRPVILGIIQSDAAVKDVMQDIFMHIWISRDKLPEIDVVRNWIFRIVYFQSYKWLRQQNVRNKAQNRLLANIPDETANNPTEDYTIFEETSRFLKAAISQLPPQALKIYIMSRERNMKIDEIASELNLSPQTIKNTLSRALHSIRTYLSEHGIYLPLILFTFFIKSEIFF
jgi:RNA polymerase sigma-70 factor (ECF subfamily)